MRTIRIVAGIVVDGVRGNIVARGGQFFTSSGVWYDLEGCRWAAPLMRVFAR